MKKRKSKRHLTALERTAYHEAGHAVACCELRLRFDYVTIVPNDKFKGRIYGTWVSPRSVQHLQNGALTLTARSYWERHLIMSLAGEVAAQAAAGCEDRVGSSADHLWAIDIAVRLCGDIEETNAYVAWLSRRTVNFITVPHRWRAVEAVAAALVIEKKIGARRCRRLVRETRSAGPT